MNRWRSQPYITEGKRRGIPSEILSAARLTADSLMAVNPDLPPLFTLKHLAFESNVPYLYLRDVVTRSNSDSCYRVFGLKKPAVGHAKDRFRYICVPHPLLLRVQRWIHSNILTHIKCHDASSAYHPNSQIKDVAQQHCQCRWIVKLDITNFFESILEPTVYQAFHRMGYQPLIAFELARICTRLRNSGNPNVYASVAAKSFTIYKYAYSHLGHLPQGAPTSPLLSNIVAQQLDERISTIADQHDLTYTRYADDITLSTTAKTFGRQRCVNVVHDVQDALRENGFWPNKAKTKIIPPRARKVVLGLLVDRDGPRLTHEFRDALRVHIHCLQHPQIGPVNHALYRGFDSVLGLQHHVFGLAAFAMGIEPQWGAQCLKQLRAVSWPTASSYPQ